ncbi:Protein CBR-NKCC-1 [Caenorhabditis briggsae]|uniref:Protein CBR-NKCC-1 n=1 Tax=Caenorhabditis briggsae TaxID=6238 RepID=A8XU23_CAEBR|nr:Protein CBR-NKCC-1 [Caenorhabditis briggsae]CAP36148.2 Protein CBR-NKCC-1 [Caenorhabditis briggsae]
MNGNGENGGKSEEKQKLLVVTDEVVEMNRVSSARFQVSKTNDEENGEEMVRKLKSGSEPPPPVAQEHVTMVTRKMSATGRFMVRKMTKINNSSLNISKIDIFSLKLPKKVTSDTNPGQLVAEIANELDVITPLEAPERSPASRAKGVHFSVGDKDSGSISDETEDRKKEKDHSHENQTTFNMKSWRNMRTIEHPPIIDFYRNSIDTDAVFNRPSMAQLIHGKQHNEEDLGFEELNVRVWERSLTEKKLRKIDFLKTRSTEKLREKVHFSTFFKFSKCKFALLNNHAQKAQPHRVTCVLLMGIVFIGSEFESKMQLGLLVILLGSIANYIFGSFFTPSELAINRGATGYSFDTLQSNFLPHFTDNNTFFSVFSVYFPAATGIMAGANISGDLANPQRSIPLGTLLAILVTTIVYLATVWMTGSTVVAFSNGTEPALFNNSVFIPPDCAPDCPFGLVSYYQVGSAPFFVGKLKFFKKKLYHCTIVTIYHFFQVVEMSSFWGPLITAGIFAATLSSALASLVSAPKVFQAVCKDRLFPRIDYFAKTYGKNEEPKRAYVLGFFLALGIVAIGDLNVIAPIISNFFLGSYALINYACFDQSFADSPGFRPGFTYYNMWISLIGAILCVFVMFIIDWFSALVTFFCFGAIFMYLLHRKPDVNWGSSTQAHSYKNALSAMIKLSTTEEHVKNYRPQVLVLSGNPASRSCLVDFANNITKGSSLLVCGQVVPYDPSDRVHTVIRKLDDVVSIWMRKRHLKAFYRAVANSSFRKGAQSLIQLTGIAKMKPNIVLVGFKSNWYMGGPTEQNLNEMNEYFGTIQDVFDWNMAVCVLRNGGVGLDFSEAMRNLNLVESSSKINVPNIENQEKVEKSTNGNLSPETVHLIEKDETARTEKSADDASSRLSYRGSFRSMEMFQRINAFYINASISINETYGSEENPDDDDHDHDDDDDDVGDSGADDDDERPNKDDDVELGVMDHQDTEKRHFSLRRRGSRRHTVEQKALLSSIQRFQRKIKKGVIDVWWLYDDGGLTLLIPHLLSIPKSYLEGARLRIFTISTSSRTMEQEQRGMAALLSKFRIDYSDVYVIADIGKKPRQETMATWQSVIDPFTAPDGSCPMGMTTKSELSAQRDKTYRQLRAGELLQEHSIKADLIVMTLPVPRKGMVSSSLYLSWLEVMTRNLPPILLVRGNQQSVLTFYS